MHLQIHGASEHGGDGSASPWRWPDDFMRLRKSRTDYPPGGRTRSNLRLMRLPVYILKVSTTESAKLRARKINKYLSILLI